MDETLMELLKKDGIDAELLAAAEKEAEEGDASLDPALLSRIPVPDCPYYGREIWNAAIAALLCGQNLLLCGPKATGKNILCENLDTVRRIYGKYQTRIHALSQFARAAGEIFVKAAAEL